MENKLINVQSEVKRLKERNKEGQPEKSLRI